MIHSPISPTLFEFLKVKVEMELVVEMAELEGEVEVEPKLEMEVEVLLLMMTVQRCGTVRVTCASKGANPDRQLFYNTRLTLAGYYKISCLSGLAPLLACINLTILHLCTPQLYRDF